MQHLREHFARFALILGAAAWVLGWGGSLVHQSVTVHVTCEVHGDVVDVGHGDQAASDDRGPVATSLDVDTDHDHDCAFHAMGVAGVPKVFGPVATVERIVRSDDPLPELNAPRGPPLLYAPKTSPPLIG